MSNCPFDGACCLLSLGEAACALAAGEAVVFPTDTVFGLGVSVKAAAGPRLLYDLKHRDAGKPVAWLVEGPETLDVYGRDVPAYARRLAETFWPGALTLVVRASAAVPAAFRSPVGTIGLRMPDSEAALALIRAVGCPLAVTSANLSGAPDTARIEDLDGAPMARTAGVYLPDDRRTRSRPASPKQLKLSKRAKQPKQPRAPPRSCRRALASAPTSRQEPPAILMPLLRASPPPCSTALATPPVSCARAPSPWKI